MADWRTELLQRLGHAPTPVRLKALDLWARSEGVETRFHNPLAAADFNEARQAWQVRDELIVYGSVDAALRDYVHLFRSAAFGRLNIGFGITQNLNGLWETIHFSGWRESDYQTSHYPVLLWRQAVAPILDSGPPVQPISELAHDIGASWHRLTRELHHHSARQVNRARFYGRRMHSAVR